MNQVLFLGLLPQNIQMPVQKYVVKNRHHRKDHHIQMGMEMGTAMMVMIMETEKMDQMEMETTTKVMKKFRLCHWDRLAAIRQQKWRRSK
jgi:hypothetical protein